MIVEIECYKGDVLLHGKSISFKDFVIQVKAVEAIYDRQEDNFVGLLCRDYGWNFCKDNVKPEFVYDRDIEKAFKIK